MSTEPDAQATRKTVLEAHNIVKRFGGAVAVDHVSITVGAGEIHAVVGENGAGKSTLMRILAGILEPDEGGVSVDGSVLEPGAKASLEAGIALVHQELSLIPEMTVAENILLGVTPTKFGVIDSVRQRKIAGDALDQIGVSVDLTSPFPGSQWPCASLLKLPARLREIPGCSFSMNPQQP